MAFYTTTLPKNVFGKNVGDKEHAHWSPFGMEGSNFFGDNTSPKKSISITGTRGYISIGTATNGSSIRQKTENDSSLQPTNITNYIIKY